MSDAGSACVSLFPVALLRFERSKGEKTPASGPVPQANGRGRNDRSRGRLSVTVSDTTLKFDTPSDTSRPGRNCVGPHGCGAHAALARTRQLLTQTGELRQQNHARREYQAEHTDQPAPAASRPAGARRRSAEPDAAGPRHILLVDDDHALRLLLTEVFEEEGFQVTPAADGEAALAVLQTTVPDVLLTDYHMPRLDGLGLLRAVHQHWPSLPVVFCTGAAELEGQVRGYEQVTFLHKPLDLKQVLHHIERAVQSQGDPGGATVGSQ